MNILSINSGSSSIKYSLHDMRDENLLASGKIEQICEVESCCVFRRYSAPGVAIEQRETSAVSNHENGLKKIFQHLTKKPAHSNIQLPHAIGHRIVHGGETFKNPVLIDDSVIQGITQMIPLAPLHNPSNLVGIKVARRFFPSLPQVAVFDTAFFRNLPRYAYQYALPPQASQIHQVRRYGFHGISYQYVAKRSADYLKRPLDSLNLIILHLGNGAGAAAISKGVCIDTSMGMTPLEGLIMGTRCGDIDPSVPIYFGRTLKMTPNEIEQLLNNESGLKGLCGVKDMRQVRELANSGDADALLAIEMYCYRIAKYV